MKDLDRHAFVTMFGGVYEHSQWIADEVFDQLSKNSLETRSLNAASLVHRFEKVFMNAAQSCQMQVLRAHPQLACSRLMPDELTTNSRREQSAAGLDQCSEVEFIRFQEMNAIYIDKYEFPFIISVKGLNRQSILEAFSERLKNDVGVEFQTALREVCRIAGSRISNLIDD